MSEIDDLSLSEAVTNFLSALSPEKGQEAQQELTKFIRWYGGDRLLRGLTALEVEKYGESLSSSLTDPEKTMEPIRNFLSFAKKKKMITVSLASHLRISKTKQIRSAKRPVEVEQIALTSEGYSVLEEELDRLKAERPNIAEQLKHAAADKDVRENAPLEAARERQGQIEARIRDIEATLKGATIIKSELKKARVIGVGCTVSLYDMTSGEKLCYTLVSPSEADPIDGKISIASPTGRALLDQMTGTVIEVDAPVGTFRYKIEDIKG